MIAIKKIDDDALRLLIKEKNFNEIKVKYNADMFLHAIPKVVDYDYAIAVDEDENPIAVLEEMKCNYFHQYNYSGGVDIWLLNCYDCLILQDCNEFSVELCQTALKLWEGKRLVLLGENWESMIPYLPDLPGVDCYYEPALSEDILLRYKEDAYTLLITFGHPHAEPMDRFRDGILFYDEVMAFTYMFSNRKELGDKNQDKHFYIIDGYYDNLGLFAIYEKIQCCAKYVKSRGFIPIINLTADTKGIYQDKPHDEIWNKFFHQPQGYTMNDISQSKNVYFAPRFYPGSIMCELMNMASEGVELDWPNGKYSDKVQQEIERAMSRFLPHPEQTIGVLARGTDYVKTHLPNHTIHANIVMICEKVDEVLANKENIQYIYVSTEDADYEEYLRKRYGQKLFMTDQQRFSTKEGQLLADYHRNDPNKRNGYLLGAEYIVSISLLSKCCGLIASGGCAGVDEAIKQNENKYEDIFVFNLGCNPG